MSTPSPGSQQTRHLAILSLPKLRSDDRAESTHFHISLNFPRYCSDLIPTNLFRKFPKLVESIVTILDKKKSSSPIETSSEKTSVIWPGWASRSSKLLIVDTFQGATKCFSHYHFIRVSMSRMMSPRMLTLMCWRSSSSTDSLLRLLR